LICAIPAGYCTSLECLHIDPEVAGTVELDRLTADQEMGWIGITVGDRFAEAGQGVA
jgi:hypothetical protein